MQNEAILQSASFNAIFMLVAAYASDLIFNTVNLNPHRRKGFKVWIIREFQQLLDHFVNVPALYYGKYVNVCRSSLYNFFVKWFPTLSMLSPNRLCPLSLVKDRHLTCNCTYISTYVYLFQDLVPRTFESWWLDIVCGKKQKLKKLMMFFKNCLTFISGFHY